MENYKVEHELKVNISLNSYTHSNWVLGEAPCSQASAVDLVVNERAKYTATKSKIQARRGYPVFIGQSLLKNQGLLREHVLSPQVMVVTDKTIAPLYLDAVRSAFVDRQCDVVILADGESSKTHDSVKQIYDALILKKHHRDTTLIALGGGVIGDMTGFAAATYQRGVSFVQIPTTLLAQVDAAVGGKTAINHEQAKNIIGAFYQPHAVIMDLATLNTLPLREFRAGLGEVIKYAILEGGDFVSLLNEALLHGLSNNQSPDLSEIIAHCCQAKINYVENDERDENGKRALLNLGHTFAHALETYTHYKRWLHGEAVAIGIYCAALLSFEMQCCDETTLSQIHKLLCLAQLPTKIPKETNLEELFRLMMNDKKVMNNQLRLILLKGLGQCYIEEQVNENKLMKILQQACEGG